MIAMKESLKTCLIVILIVLSMAGLFHLIFAGLEAMNLN
jgi:hypothetical protein